MPHYTQTCAPLLQLAINHPPRPGWTRGSSSYPATSPHPLVAARSQHTIEFFALVKNTEQEVPDVEWTLRGSVSGSGAATTPAPPSLTFEDVSWSHYMTHTCVAVCSDGSLMEIDTAKNKTTTTTVTTQPHPESYVRAGYRCVCSPHHPRQVIVSLHSSFGIADIRARSSWREMFSLKNSSSSSPTLSCPYTGQWISALSDFPSSSSPPSDTYACASAHQYSIAIATTTSVLLFDVRRPRGIVAQWKHGMEDSSLVVSSKKSRDGVDAIYTAPPDRLLWLASTKTTSSVHHRSLLAVNTKMARGVVCEWEEQRNRGDISVAFDRRQDHGGDGDGEEEEEEEDEWALLERTPTRRYTNTNMNTRMTWKPACWTETRPSSTKTMFDLHGSGAQYPPALSSAVAYGAAHQRQCRIEREMLEGTGGGHGVRLLEEEQDEGNGKVRMIGIAPIPLHPWIVEGDNEEEEEEEGDGMLLVMEASTQEVTVTQIVVESTGTTGTRTLNRETNMNANSATRVHVLRPGGVGDVGGGGVGGVLEYTVDAGSGRITKDPQVMLAAMAAGMDNASGGEDANGDGDGSAVLHTANVRLYPAFPVKQRTLFISIILLVLFFSPSSQNTTKNNSCGSGSPPTPRHTRRSHSTI